MWPRPLHKSILYPYFMIPSAVELFSLLGLRKCCTGKENFASVAISWSMGKHFSGSLDRFMKLISILVDTSNCGQAVLRACLCIAVAFWWSLFLIISNQVMLSFGAAPASSCGRGNSSALPDYLPEEDDNVVISDKVSNERHRNFIMILTQSLHLTYLLIPLGNCKGRRKWQRNWMVFQCVQFL